MFAFKVFTKSGLNRVIPFGTERAAMRAFDELRVNGCFIQVGKRGHRLDSIESIYIDDKQIYPAPLDTKIDVLSFAFKGE